MWIWDGRREVVVEEGWEGEWEEMNGEGLSKHEADEQEVFVHAVLVDGGPFAGDGFPERGRP